ncbi:Ubiquinone/menaquinone biosynthesis C-methyltransferase UbiE [ANME-1 cluster archaeon GoMg1]|nr:Ubiquinone/menaquinone biosynthesis C-methyltransferase UbiE [ANME-1 cluster archaeon GoMg1]
MKNGNVKDAKKAEIEFEKKQMNEQYEIRSNFDPTTDESKWFKYRKDMLSYLALEKNDKILDYGSATCEISEWLASEGYNVTACDISYDLLAFSKKRDKSRRLKYECADCEELAFKDEAFDKIICFEILHHLPNPEKGIKEMYRILRRGGRILVSEPNSLSPVRRLSEILLKEVSLEKSFCPWNLRKMFEKRFKAIKFGYEYEPEPCIYRRGGYYHDLYCKFVTKTKIFLPFLGAITLVAEKKDIKEDEYEKKS